MKTLAAFVILLAAACAPVQAGPDPALLPPGSSWECVVYNGSCDRACSGTHPCELLPEAWCFTYDPSVTDLPAAFPGYSCSNSQSMCEIRRTHLTTDWSRASMSATLSECALAR